MNKNLLTIYIISYFISLFLFFKTPKKVYRPKEWYCKSLLIYIAGGLILYSILFNNNYIDKYLLGYLLFINIFALLPLTLENGHKISNILSFSGIIYLLLIFSIKDFNFKGGKLVNSNTKWIYSHIIILVIWYYLLDKKTFIKTSKIGAIILILYPLLFPMNEYFIHRIFSLSLAVSITWYYYNLF